MKRTALLLTLISVLLIILSSAPAMAQVIITPPTATPTPEPPRDLDGDGLPDVIDQCPLEPGPTANFGCPVTPTPPTGGGDPNQPPSNPGEQPPPGQPGTGVTQPPPPPFVPPTLPDGCAVTPAQQNRVNVRREPKMDAEVIGSLSPGVVYEALGYIVSGTDVWMQLLDYEGSDGVTPGYSAQSVLMTSTFCPQIPGFGIVGDGAVGGFAPNPPEGDLCWLTVGYDADFYGSDFDPVLTNESSIWAAFYFEAFPGEPISAGTPISGVMFINGFHELPPESPHFFDNPDFAVAAMTDPAVLDQAVNGGAATAWELAFPNPNGGVMSTNGTVFYRLTDPANLGSCGPIVSGEIDDFAVAEDENVQAFHCWTYDNSTTVEMCACPPGATQDCLDFLSTICTGDGAVYESSWAGDSCWFGQTSANASREPMGFTVGIMFSTVGCDPMDPWWVALPSFFRQTYDLWQRPGTDGCVELPSLDRETVGGQARVQELVNRRVAEIVDPNPANDCDGNGVPDLLQFPAPDCSLDDLTIGDAGETQDDVDWWRQVLPLMCGDTGWFLMYQTYPDGTREVVNVGCGDWQNASGS